MFDTEITNEKLIVSIYGDGKSQMICKIGEGAANDKKLIVFIKPRVKSKNYKSKIRPDKNK